ncbi:hypothetical protein FS749_004842, partial [Ceratobasidium sp. UAMH 11750]
MSTGPFWSESRAKAHSDYHCKEENRRIFKSLIAGLDLAPLPLRNPEEAGDDVVIPFVQVLEGVVEELARQYHVNIHACAVWGETGGTVVTA